MVARGAGGVRGRETSSALCLFVFLPVQGVPIGQKIITREGTGFFSPIVSVSFSLFLRWCCAVLCFLFCTKYRISKKKISTLPGACTYRYVRHAAFGFSWMEHRALGICKSPVCTYSICLARLYSVPFFFLARVTGGIARDAKRMWRPDCFFLKHGGRRLVLSSCQCATTIIKKIHSVMDLSPLLII